MRRIALATISVLWLGTLVLAQGDPVGGNIGVFMDQAGTNCDLVDAAGSTTYSVVHLNTTGVKAVQYAVNDNGMTAVFLADINAFPLVIGNSHTGIAVSYNGCITGTFLVQQMIYSTLGTSPPCSSIDIVPDPFLPSNSIEMSDCSDNLISFSHGLSSPVNSDATCPCTRAVQETTWSKVKSLYK